MVWGLSFRKQRAASCPSARPGCANGKGVRRDPKRNEIDRPTGQFRLSFWVEAPCSALRGWPLSNPTDNFRAAMKPRVRRSRFLLAQLSHALGGLGRNSCPTGCAGKLPPRPGRLSTLGIALAASRPALPLGLQPTLAICVGATDDCSRRKNVPSTSRAVSSIDLQAMLYIPMLQQCSSSPRKRQRRSARPSIRAESSPLRSSCAGASLASPTPRRHGNAPVSLLIGNPCPYRSACRRDCAAAARTDGQRWATAGWRGRTWPSRSSYYRILQPIDPAR